MKEIGYFEVLKSVINKNKIDEADIKKHFSSWQAIKWLADDAKTCYTLNMLNVCPGINRSLHGIDTLTEYKFIKNTVNLPKNKYIPFLKNDKEMNLIIKYLSTYFKTGNETTKEYMRILKGDRLLTLLDKISYKGNRNVTNKNILELRNAITKKRKELKQL